MSVVLKPCWGFVFVFLLIGCRDYESEQYGLEEDLAIEQLVSEFTDAEYMLSANEYTSERPKLFIVSKLDNSVKIVEDFVETFSEADGVRVYIERELSEQTIEERKVFKALTKGVLEVRLLTADIRHDSLTIEVISEEVFKYKTKEGLGVESEKDADFFGYLLLSRIIFNRDFTVGYMHYAFYCGVGCFWWNNIEIIKRQGKWSISKRYSGGIA